LPVSFPVQIIYRIVSYHSWFSMLRRVRNCQCYYHHYYYYRSATL